MTILPFPTWCPDLPDLADGTTIALNVIPITSESYGPLASLNEYTTGALDGQCLGAYATESKTSVITIFGGTIDKLYQLVSGSLSWADVSIAGGYTVGLGDSWHFETFGNSVFATDFNDAIQVFVMGISTNFAVLSSGAPNARYMCTPKNFLMVGNTFDSVGGTNPSRLWWSASDDPTTWPTPGSTTAQQDQSDFNDFQGPWGAIKGLFDSLAGADVAIFFEHAVWRGVYVGPPDIFDFFPCENVRGCRCPNAMVNIGAIILYPGEDGFYSFDGANSTPIGVDKFDAWFLKTVNNAYLYNVIGAADPLHRAAIWIFPSTASSNGIPDTALIYRWDIQRASYAQFSAEWLLRVLSFGVTLDAFSALGFTDLDTIPYSLDSPVWVGGALSLGAVDTSHQLAYLNGPPLAAQIGTKTVQPTPGRLSWVDETRPLVQLTAGGPATIAVAGRNNLYDPIAYGPDVPPDINGVCPQRLDARYANGLLKIPAGAAWTHALGIDANAQPSGER